MAVQPNLCRTWSETPKTSFLTTRLIYELTISSPFLPSFSDARSQSDSLFNRDLVNIEENERGNHEENNTAEEISCVFDDI